MVAAEDKLGVYYHRADSPGFLVRLLVDVIDFIAIMILAVIFQLGWLLLVPPGSGLNRFTTIILLGLWWIYLVPMKRSGFGTFGYAIFGVRVVNLKGEPPGLLRLTVRTLCFYVFNPLFDLIFLAIDDNRQALRDRFSGTYVIRRSARPAGKGRFFHPILFFCLLSLIYREVSRKA